MADNAAAEGGPLSGAAGAEVKLLDDNEQAPEQIEQTGGEAPEAAPGPGAPPDPLTLPPHGTEVFLGGIPKAATDEDVKKFCETVGTLHSLRVVKDPNSADANKGFAFAVYHTKETAQDAIQQLNGKVLEGFPGWKPVRVVISSVKNRLFLGNVPKDMSKEDIHAALSTAAPGLEDVEVLPTKVAGDLNRGWCFVTYYNHQAAEVARKALLPPGFMLRTSGLTVTWMEPRQQDETRESDEPVRAIYVTKLPPGANTENMKAVFSAFGAVERVAIPPARNSPHPEFGFVYFTERESALKAVAAMETSPPIMLGVKLQVSLARAQMARRPPGQDGGRGGFGRGQPMFGRGQPMRGYMGGRGAGYPAGPIIDPSSLNMQNMTMVPMMLPTGEIGYVLQEAQGMAPPAFNPAQPGYASPGLGERSHGPIRTPPPVPGVMPPMYGTPGRGGGRFGGSPMGGRGGGRYRPY
mmetsp:Transcript_27935/g.49937  ORF Transcript_27935/g.49937 Transcript_27935/m.49937 type:complete len:465 (-) Transcript_27935:646-2040(-)